MGLAICVLLLVMVVQRMHGTSSGPGPTTTVWAVLDSELPAEVDSEAQDIADQIEGANQLEARKQRAIQRWESCAAGQDQAFVDFACGPRPS